MITIQYFLNTARNLHQLHSKLNVRRYRKDGYIISSIKEKEYVFAPYICAFNIKNPEPSMIAINYVHQYKEDIL